MYLYGLSYSPSRRKRPGRPDYRVEFATVRRTSPMTFPFYIIDRVIDARVLLWANHRFWKFQNALKTYT